MKRIACLLLAAACLLLPLDARAEDPVEELLRQMTVEEKVGQMTQLDISTFSVKDAKGIPIRPHTLDLPRLRQIVVERHVGSLLNSDRFAYTLEHWHEITGAVAKASSESRLGIPVLYGVDSVHGFNYLRGGTIFPQNLALASTWNPALAERSAAHTARETRAAGIPWTFSPVCDLGRNPVWPRLYETFGEDPHLVTAMASGAVRGYQGANPADMDRVAACMKHFAGYSLPLTGQDRTPAWIPERYLREYFLPSFQGAVNAGALTAMINSANVNGVPVHSDPFMLDQVLRTEMGFGGLAVTDWEDVRNLVRAHRVAADYKEATWQAVTAGIDMCMEPMTFEFTDSLLALVREGRIPESRLDASVRRILRVKRALGLWDNPVYPADAAARIGTPEARRDALEGARQSVVLLKNEGLLPLRPGAKLLVTGPTADRWPALAGGWTWSWQGATADEDPTLYPKDKRTLLGWLREKGPVEYVPGATFDKVLDLEAVEAAAKRADVVVLCLGEDAYAEGEGNIADLALPDAQVQLARAAASAGRPVVLVLLEGRPRLIHRVEPSVKAALVAFQPGTDGGQALAEVLFGQVNPSGRLPVTYPRHPNRLLPYDRKWSDLALDQYPFGHGLSYTTFAYGPVQLASASVPREGAVDVAVDVTNTGPRAGAEVVQLYVSDLVASVAPSVRRLQGFQRVELAPGETRRVQFAVKASQLGFYGRDNRYVVEPGEFEVQVGGKTAKFVLR